MLTPSIPEAALPVRLATPLDEEDLVAMVETMHQDGEWGTLDHEGRPFAFSPIKARTIVQRATQVNRNAPDAGQAWLGVIGEPGSLRGSAYVALQEPSMSEGFFLIELWNWLCPELRNTEASDALIEFSKSIADMKHMRLVMAAMTQQRMGKARFYTRRFGAPIGNVYNYSPNGAVA